MIQQYAALLPTFLLSSCVQGFPVPEVIHRGSFSHTFSQYVAKAHLAGNYGGVKEISHQKHLCGCSTASECFKGHSVVSYI